MAKKQFVSKGLQGKTLIDVKKIANINEREFRQLARAEFKAVNRRIRRVEESGYNSPAVMEIRQKLGENLFTIKGKSTPEIIALLNESRNFTSAKTSTIKGTKEFVKRMQKRKSKKAKSRKEEKEEEQEERQSWNTYTILMQTLTKEYPRFAYELALAREKYKDFNTEVQVYCDSMLKIQNMSYEDICKSIYDEFSSRVGQILQATYSNYHDGFRGFRYE